MRYNHNPQTMEECADTIEATTAAITRHPGFAPALRANELNLGAYWDIKAAAEALHNACTRLDQLWSEAREAALEEAKAKKGGN